MHLSTVKNGVSRIYGILQYSEKNSNYIYFLTFYPDVFYVKIGIQNTYDVRFGMKSTGIVRRIDEVGRIVLPIELRTVLGIDNRDQIEIFTENDSIILKKHEPSCIFCGQTKDLITYKDKPVCSKCAAGLADLTK